MVDTFAMFFSIEEVALVFVFIWVDYLSFIGGFIVDPFTIIDSTAGIGQYPLPILLILNPISNILIAILIEIGSFPILLSV